MEVYKIPENGLLQGTRKWKPIRYQKMDGYKVPENGSI